MAIPSSLDFDKIAHHALTDLGYAITKWLEGRPLDEVAFMNHVTGRIVRRRRGCDVGVQTPMQMHAKVYELHRKGPRQTDRFGADLAVTVSVPGESFMKTALFQIKRSRDYSVDVELKQLHEAQGHELTQNRSFVFAVDESRRSFRIKRVSEVESSFDGQKRKRFDASAWLCLADFLWQWLSCDLGQPSNPNDSDSIEKMLEGYIVEPQSGLTWNSESADQSQDDFLPARSWLRLEFRGKN